MLFLFKWLVVRPLKFFKTNKTLKKKFSSSRLGTCFTTTLPAPPVPHLQKELLIFNQY